MRYEVLSFPCFFSDKLEKNCISIMVPVGMAVGWIGDELRGEIREKMREGIEDKMRKCGELAGVKKEKKMLRILGLVYTPVEVEPTQSKETIKKNVEVMEREMFATSEGSKDKYFEQIIRVIVGGEIFPSEIFEGCIRWCLEDRREVCKVVIKVDKVLMWAERVSEGVVTMETMPMGDVLTMPLDKKTLLLELAWSELIESVKQDDNGREIQFFS